MTNKSFCFLLSYSDFSYFGFAELTMHSAMKRKTSFSFALLSFFRNFVARQCTTNNQAIMKRKNTQQVKRCIFLMMMCLSVNMFCTAQTNDPMVVKTRSGLVKGIDQEGSMAFLGIPYATVERFMPPQPVKKWKGVRVCDHWGPMTMQQTNRPMTEEQMSENCCVLNVWTTSLPNRSKVKDQSSKD